MSHNYYKIMRIAVRENDPVWQAIHEVVADEDNKFGKTTVWSFSSGDIDVYIIPIYYGKYWKRRFEALTGIGFHEITPEDLREASEYINTSETIFNRSKSCEDELFDFMEDNQLSSIKRLVSKNPHDIDIWERQFVNIEEE